MNRNSSLFATIFCCIIFCAYIQLYGTEINKTFPKKENIELRTILGSCKIIKSEDDLIHINLTHSFKGDEFHANFSEKHDKLFLEEKFLTESPEGKSLWEISVPVRTKIIFKSATGNFNAEGVESYIQVETGTGFITMDEVNGDFNVSTGTGSIEITNIIINGSSKFSSGTGNVSVTLSHSPVKDISVNTGTGTAVLDYQRNPLKGVFEFGAIQNKGRIVSPIKFENESLEPNGNLYNEIKSFRINAKDEPRININTGTGLAKLIK